MPWRLPDALETSAVAACAFATAKAFAEGDARGRTPARSAGGGPLGPVSGEGGAMQPASCAERFARSWHGHSNLHPAVKTCALAGTRWQVGPPPSPKPDRNRGRDGVGITDGCARHQRSGFSLRDAMMPRPAGPHVTVTTERRRRVARQGNAMRPLQAEVALVQNPQPGQREHVVDLPDRLRQGRDERREASGGDDRAGEPELGQDALDQTVDQPHVP